MRLELQRVTAAYGSVVALRDVSLIVPSGRVVALLGPNGAGKTTLLSVASGLLLPKAGRVLLDRTDVTLRPPDERARRGVSHITEGRSIFPGLTVADNLRMFAPQDNEGEAVERAADAFPRLKERMAQIAGTMSGGEQQMLAVARGYVRNSPVMLLDEVSLGLAPMLVDEIFEYLSRIAKEGTSLLIVEQYLAKALALADHVYVLVHGRIVFAGEPGELSSSDIFTRYLGAETGELSASSADTKVPAKGKRVRSAQQRATRRGSRL